MKSHLLAFLVVLVSTLDATASVDCPYTIRIFDHPDYMTEFCVDQIKTKQVQGDTYRVSFRDTILNTNISHKKVNIFFPGYQQTMQITHTMLMTLDQKLRQLPGGRLKFDKKEWFLYSNESIDASRLADAKYEVAKLNHWLRSHQF